MITFKEWLKLTEVGTGTNAVACFKGRFFSSPVERSWPWTQEDPFFKKKRKGLNEEDLPSAPMKATQSSAMTSPDQQPTLQVPVHKRLRGRATA